MKLSQVKLLAAMGLAVGILVSGFFLWETQQLASALDAPAHPSHVERKVSSFSGPVEGDIPSNPILLSFDDVVANIGPHQTGRSHMLIVKLDLELFAESDRKLIEKRQGGVKHTILELARGQQLADLKTLSGKLYFKEQIISNLNTYLNQPAVKDIHFSSFLLR